MLGAPLVLLAFFLAPLLGILWWLILTISRKSNVLPYGPWLSIAGILCLFIGQPILEWYLHLLGH